MRSAASIATVAAMAAGLLCSACVPIVILPGPGPRHPDSRERVPDALIERLQARGSSRSDVLLALGAPDVQLREERVFLYLWSSRSGPAHFDVMFEFDGAGRLVRSGDLKTLLEGDLGRIPIGSSADPVSIPVRWSYKSPEPDGRILIDGETLVLERAGEPPETLEIPAGGVERMKYMRYGVSGPSFDKQKRWRWYTLTARAAQGQGQDLRLSVEAGSLLDLAQYLRRHSPDMKIMD